MQGIELLKTSESTLLKASTPNKEDSISQFFTIFNQVAQKKPQIGAENMALEWQDVAGSSNETPSLQETTVSMIEIAEAKTKEHKSQSYESAIFPEFQQVAYQLTPEVGAVLPLKMASYKPISEHSNEVMSEDLVDSAINLIPAHRASGLQGVSWINQPEAESSLIVANEVMLQDKELPSTQKIPIAWNIPLPEKQILVISQEGNLRAAEENSEENDSVFVGDKLLNQTKNQSVPTLRDVGKSLEFVASENKKGSVAVEQAFKSLTFSPVEMQNQVVEASPKETLLHRALSDEALRVASNIEKGALLNENKVQQSDMVYQAQAKSAPKAEHTGRGIDVGHEGLREAPKSQNLAAILNQIKFQKLEPVFSEGDIKKTLKTELFSVERVSSDAMLRETLRETFKGQDLSTILNQIQSQRFESVANEEGIKQALKIESLPVERIIAREALKEPAQINATQTPLIFNSMKATAYFKNAEMALAEKDGIAGMDAIALGEDGVIFEVQETTYAARFKSNPVLDRMPSSQSRDWGNTLQQNMVKILSQNLQSAEMQLSPPDLGTLQVKVKMTGDMVSLEFKTETSMVKHAIEQTVDKLKDAFLQQGLNLADVQVSTQLPQRRHSGEKEQQLFFSGSHEQQGLLVEEAISRRQPERKGLVDYFI